MLNLGLSLYLSTLRFVKISYYYFHVTHVNLNTKLEKKKASWKLNTAASSRLATNDTDIATNQAGPSSSPLFWSHFGLICVQFKNELTIDLSHHKAWSPICLPKPMTPLPQLQCPRLQENCSYRWSSHVTVKCHTHQTVPTAQVPPSKQWDLGQM